MRMRTKKWARPELAVCPFYIQDATKNKGNWKNAFKKEQPIWLELGCGKGSYLAQASIKNLDKNFIALDLSSDMLGLTKRNVENAFKENPIDNVFVAWQNIERLDNIFDYNGADIIERIFINFCNPWHKPAQYKKRLTHSRQLMKYREILVDEGEIWFKTDDDQLFEHSLEYFKECGFEIKYITYDLHQSGFEPNYKTEHEIMYSNEGIKIKFLIAVKKPLDKRFTEVYFVRHCQPDYSIKTNDRPLTQRGTEDTKKVTAFLKDKEIDLIFSSPFKRSYDTVKPFADENNLDITVIDDFRERQIGNGWVEDYNEYSRKQWEDFHYKLDGGESIKDVEKRNIIALKKILKENQGKKIVIATHGMALSVILRHYNSKFSYEDFLELKDKMPYIVKCQFDEERFIRDNAYDIV